MLPHFFTMQCDSCNQAKEKFQPTKFSQKHSQKSPIQMSYTECSPPIHQIVLAERTWSKTGINLKQQQRSLQYVQVQHQKSAKLWNPMEICRLQTRRHWELAATPFNPQRKICDMGNIAESPSNAQTRRRKLAASPSNAQRHRELAASFTPIPTGAQVLIAEISILHIHRKNRNL